MTEETKPSELRDFAERTQEENKQLKAQLAEAAAAKRELAFHKAGVDVESAAGKLLLRAYDGDLDVDKIKAEWEPLAPAPAAPVEEPETVVAEGEAEAIAAERALRAGGAATPGEEPTADPTDVARYHEARAAGKTHDQAQVDFLQGLFNGAVAGDKRAIVP